MQRITPQRFAWRTLRRVLLAPGLALGAIISLGCGAPAGMPAPAADLAGAPAELNARFRDPNLDIAALTATFEVETREVAAERDALVGTLVLHSGLAVADIGAGTGLFLGPLAAAVGPTGKVYAIDISPRLVEHLAARAQLEGHRQVQAVLCTDRSVELPPASIDVAYICDTYHHFEHPADTLASLHRALRPGGRLVIADFDRVPGVSRDWVLEHVRCGRETVMAEVEAAGFQFIDAPQLAGLKETFVLRFRRP